MANILFRAIKIDVDGWAGDGEFGVGGSLGQGGYSWSGGFGFGDYGGGESGNGLGCGGFGECYTDGSGCGWHVPVQGFGPGSAKQRKSQ